MIYVYPIPPVLPYNPYVDLLYEAMSVEGGISVRRIRPVWTGVLEALFRPGYRLLHLHLFDELGQRPSRLTTQVRTSAFITMLRILKRAGVRLVWTIHNLEPHEMYHDDLADELYQQVLRIIDKGIVHSVGAAQEVRARYDIEQRRLYVIPHGHYIGVYGPLAERHTARQALALPQEGFVFVAIGALRPYKQFDRLITTFCALRDARARLVIAGPSHSPGYIRQLRQYPARDTRVSIREGFIPHAAMPLYAAAADIIVLPYTHFLSSGVLLWAMSYGRPVIAPRYRPILDLVIEEETGFLFNPNDEQSLVEVMKYSMTYPYLERLGRQAQAHVQERDWTTIARRTAAVYFEAFNCV